MKEFILSSACQASCEEAIKHVWNVHTQASRITAVDHSVEMKPISDEGHVTCVHVCKHPLTLRTFNARPIQVTHYQFKPCQHFTLKDFSVITRSNPPFNEHITHQQYLQYC